MVDIKHLLVILIGIHVHFHILQMFLDLIESKYNVRNMYKPKILHFLNLENLLSKN